MVFCFQFHVGIGFLVETISMAGKSNKGRGRKGSQQSAVTSSEQSASGDATLNDSSGDVMVSEDTSLSESNGSNPEVKDHNMAPDQQPTKQGSLGDL